MIPVEKLIKAQTMEKACQLLAEHQDFNLIPIEANGEIIGYVERGNPILHPVDLNVSVGIGCSILDIVDVFAERQFCFILGKWRIEGYIHFSDLNHPLVNLPFYILLQAVETHALSLIQDQFNEEVLHHICSGASANRISRNFNRRKANDSNRSLLNEVGLNKMLKAAVHLERLNLSDEEIAELYKVRNSLSHVPEQLIWEYDDVKRLVWVTRKCYTILNSSLTSTG